jgi:transposase
MFPHLAGLRVTDVQARGATVRVHAETSVVAAACPVCAVSSGRVHSRYQRRLLDAAVAGRETVVHLRVRRFRCVNADCLRKIFVEQVEGLTVRYGRASVLGGRLLASVAVALGGRPGSRLTDRLGLATGRMTLLRLIRALPLPPVPALRAVGVDDFALRRGHRYGTVLVDMLSRRVIDVLADRSADSFAAWLERHQGVEVICRDRAGCYAEGARRGAPAAIQVADRWHLLHNLSEAVAKVAAGHRRCLQPARPADTDGDCDPLQDHASATATAAAERPREVNRDEGYMAQRTRARHADVHALLAKGIGVYVIARQLTLDPKTVQRYAATADVETLIGPRNATRDSVLDPFKPYLLERCTQPDSSTTRLLTELRERGYTAGERTLRRWLVAHRGTPTTAPPPPPVPKARDITALIMRPIQKLADTDRAELARICDLCPDLAAARDLARGFAHLVRTRTGTDTNLRAWVEHAEHGPVEEIRTFAAGLRKDWTAIVAGLTQHWSSGLVEGSVNRIKTIKRQMFGRAKPDLLRKRVILAQ